MRIFQHTAAKHILGTSLVIAAVVLGTGGAYYLGFREGIKRPENVVVESIANVTENDSTLDFALFWEAWKRLRENHLHGAEISEKDFLYGAIEGLAATFNDPNTVLLRADNGDSQKFEEDISGSFGGVGAEIGMKGTQLIIVAPLKHSPAELAGLKSGDAILKVDGENTASIGVTEAVKQIRGPIGTTVTLTIGRAGWESPRDISVVRETIKIPNLDWEIVDGNVMHIKLYSFNAVLARDFYEAAIESVSQNVDGIVIDLRNNPGGYLQVAVDVAGWFMEKGVVVASERFRGQPDVTFRSRGNGVFKDIPTVVLVNQGSASASEILAGALRDQRGVQLVGEHTFGKGTVQELQKLRDGSKLKITIANWLLPSGKVIEKNGLEPDYTITITEADAKAGRDPQLEKALELLRTEIARRT